MRKRKCTVHSCRWAAELVVTGSAARRQHCTGQLQRNATLRDCEFYSDNRSRRGESLIDRCVSAALAHHGTPLPFHLRTKERMLKLKQDVLHSHCASSPHHPHPTPPPNPLHPFTDMAKAAVEAPQPLINQSQHLLH